jgi:fructose-1,6-bisphosphatase II
MRATSTALTPYRTAIEPLRRAAPGTRRPMRTIAPPTVVAKGLESFGGSNAPNSGGSLGRRNARRSHPKIVPISNARRTVAKNVVLQDNGVEDDESFTAIDANKRYAPQHSETSKSNAETNKFSAAQNHIVHQISTEPSGGTLASCNRNLALEMVRVTESAAVAAARWLGKGDKIAADGAAVRAMRQALMHVEFSGRVVIGEGEKDNAPMLHNGEVVGTGVEPVAEIAVDPIDGTTLVAGGRNGAVSVIAIAERGAMFDPGPAFYMDKLVVGPAAVGHVDITRSPTVNVHAIARALKKPVSEVTCVVLDRDRHVGLIEELRMAGARIKLISDGDVEAAIAVCDPESGVDALFGIGGTPEGVIAAAAIRCMGGEIQGQLWVRSPEEAAACRAAGMYPMKVLRTNDLCGGEEVFFTVTGISDGDLLDGVNFHDFGATTHSYIMRAPSGTIRYMKTYHRWKDRLGQTNKLQDSLTGGGGVFEL